jgi:EAL and modified HD-GYP domain-containing signal transduction protein
MSDVFVARQPIFNRRLVVVGYELLFRDGDVGEALIESPEGATATVILNSFTEIGLERIVANKTAWVNVSREFVLSGLAKVVPPGLVGIEIRDAEPLDGEFLTAVSALKRRGYRLALDDFRYRPGVEPLVRLVDAVKLDASILSREELTRMVSLLEPYGVTLIAKKLESTAAYELAAEAGCDQFQGFFFCRPVLLQHRGIAANRLALLQVVAALHDQSCELSDIEELIAHDVALSYRLLRYINSAFFGLRSEVRSSGQALALLGLPNVRRWATLTVLANIDDKPSELTATALVRARFCERAGEELGLPRPTELFTIGMFSVIDALLDAPMAEVLSSLPFPEDMREALIHHRGERGLLLDCVTAIEVGDLEHATTIISKATDLYLEALMWANSAAHSLLGEADADAAR